MRNTILPFDASGKRLALPALSLPLQHAPMRPGNGLRPKILARWAAELPVGNTTVAAHQILAKLRDLNQTRYAVRDRLELHKCPAPAGI